MDEPSSVAGGIGNLVAVAPGLFLEWVQHFAPVSPPNKGHRYVGTMTDAGSGDGLEPPTLASSGPRSCSPSSGVRRQIAFGRTSDLLDPHKVLVPDVPDLVTCNSSRASH